MTQEAGPKPPRAPYTDIRMGDVVRMRKPHPCGSDRWEVVRLGADIGIRCEKCARRVLLPRSQFLRQVKALLQAGPEADTPAAGQRLGE
jgi:hypothetical protein